ncbi:MAG: DUF5343 domain-containing protein [Archaeoglobales archaeon]|nr:DUF5343 domain-containing protein [Archaeoglobales archaeon]
MTKYPYVTVSGKLKGFFSKIQETGEPHKVTQKWLESIGFKSSNDRYILHLLKDLGFVDSNGVPTDLWKKYRNKELAPKVLAEAIKNAYKQLFDTYPDAYRKDKEALRNFFASETGLSERTVERIIQTFKALCELADFREVEDRGTLKEESPHTVDAAHRPVQMTDVPAKGVTINVNIQLQLPATSEEEIYDKLFRSLKRNLLSG